MTEPEEGLLQEDSAGESEEGVLRKESAEEAEDGQVPVEEISEEDALFALREQEAKKALRKTAVLLTILSTLFLVAFTAYIIGTFHTAEIRKGNYRFVGFSRRGDVNFALTASAESLANMPLSLEKYNSRVYYDGLTGADRLVYRAFEVALENGWEEVYLDEFLTENCRRTPLEILVLFALDSPFLEQNIRMIDGHHFTRFVSGTDGSPFGMMAEGVRVVVDNFSPGRLEKKKEALAEAIRISADLTGETDEEKALAIFRYLLDNVDYLEEKGFDHSYYLYDALTQGRTNCDGFTNSFALLAQLSGLRVFEKNHQPADGSAGHTWNCVMLDGVWYNVDVTFAQGYITASGENSQESEDEFYMALYATFGFPDAREKQLHDYEDLTPPCRASLIQPDLVLETRMGVPCGDLICAALEQEGKGWLFLVTNFSLDTPTLQQVANRVGSIHSSFFNPSDTEYCYVIRVKGKG